jgi:hypothetical protein
LRLLWHEKHDEGDNMNQQTQFFELLTHLTAHENQSVNEQCWRGLGERALRFAYTHDSFREINKLLMNAPPEINKRLVSWFKRLGIKVVPHSATKGGWRATAVEDRKRQNEMYLAAKTLPQHDGGHRKYGRRQAMV